MTVEQLSWYIDDTLNRRLMGIEGVSVVSRMGGVSREIRVELDPVRMQAQGVTASQINQQLACDQHERRRRPRRDRRLRAIGSGDRQRAQRPPARRDPDRDGRRPDDPAQLRSPASAINGPSRPSYGIQNGRQVVSFMIQKAKGYSDVTVYHAVHG